MKIGRDSEITREYLHSEHTVSEIADRHGISEQMVYLVLKRHQIPRRSALGIHVKKRPKEKIGPVSSIHILAGVCIRKVRKLQKLSLSSLADRSELSQAKLHKIEEGVYDWKLTEIGKICRALQLTVPQLLSASLPKQTRAS